MPFLAMGDNTSGIVVIGGNGFSITGNKISGTVFQTAPVFYYKIPTPH
jgi:hypothetical protein